jgi:hypothetical protein
MREITPQVKTSVRHICPRLSSNRSYFGHSKSRRHCLNHHSQRQWLDEQGLDLKIKAQATTKYSGEPRYWWKEAEMLYPAMGTTSYAV